MGKIIDLAEFNLNRRDNKEILELGSENVFKLSKDEAKDFFIEYLTDEIDFIAKGISDNTKKDLTDKVNNRFFKLQQSLEKHIDKKFDKLTETIISQTTSRLFNEEVNRRVDEKLRKLKELL
jgi:carboxylesterase type B